MKPGTAAGSFDAAGILAVAKCGVLHLAALACLSLAVAAGASARATNVKPAFQLPRPTGTNSVGTTVWRLVDDSRRETLANSGEPREVEVIAYYPASRSAKSPATAYLREGRSEVRALFPPQVGSESLDALAEVRTHATVDAEPRPGDDPLPVLVFSHGYGGFASAHAGLLEDLASHGYVVLSVVHPYESGGATLRNGSVVSFLGTDDKPRPGFLEVVREWEREDEVMAAVTKADTDEEQRRLLREYFSGLGHTTAALRRWVEDTRLVVDRLDTLPPGTVAGRLSRRLDRKRIGVFGHSMGGVTAGQFCVEDDRCAAGLNLDGIPQFGTMIDTLLRRPFLMVYSERPGRAGASDSIYRRATSAYYRADVLGTLHLDFSDMNFWPVKLRERKAVGAIAPEKATAITRIIVRQFFDETLLGRRSALLAGKESHPEITLRIIRPVPLPSLF
jgi:predicted dienelactone hydrolase